MADVVGVLVCLVIPVCLGIVALGWLLYGVDEWRRMFRAWLDKK